MLISVTVYVVVVLSPKEPQPKKQSIASRLSEKFQSSLSSDCNKDDDFQPDRKRFRDAEQEVIIDASFYIQEVEGQLNCGITVIKVNKYISARLVCTGCNVHVE